MWEAHDNFSFTGEQAEASSKVRKKSQPDPLKVFSAAKKGISSTCPEPHNLSLSPHTYQDSNKI